MNRVTIELWMWLSNELRGDFESPSEMRSIKEEKVKVGTTIWELLNSLARGYPPIAKNVFDTEAKRLYSHVVITYNGRVISPHIVHNKILRDGDKITILPMYVGG